MAAAICLFQHNPRMLFCYADTYCGHCNSHDVFVIAVTKRNSNGSEEVWDVLREYGDFKCLHSHILKQVSIDYQYSC